MSDINNVVAINLTKEKEYHYMAISKDKKQALVSELVDLFKSAKARPLRSTKDSALLISRNFVEAHAKLV